MQRYNKLLKQLYFSYILFTLHCNNVESLPAGLYIQGGKKLLKRD